MNRADSLRRIQRLMAVFVENIKASAAMGHTDINLVAEDILVPLLRIVLDYPNLKNLNAEEKKNFPGVDLGDFQKRVAIQVTSTSTTKKVEDSLKTFVGHGLDAHFSHLRFYIITERQGRYKGEGWADIIDGKFIFNKEKDILDSLDILGRISHLEDEEVHRIESYLETAIEKKVASSSTLSVRKMPEPQEQVFSNILELLFAEDLFVANVRKIAAPKPRGRRSAKPSLSASNANSRIVWDALKQIDQPNIRDWICYSGQLFTFKDLRRDDEPLRLAVETETIEKITSSEFYDSGEDQERAFKFLLVRCLSMRLAPKDVAWENEVKRYIFLPFEGEDVRKVGRRSVYTIKKKKGSAEVLHHRHLAFRVRYHRFSNRWFATITPDWFFTYNGINKSIFHSELVDGLKGFETNDTVLRHTRVICEVLQSEIKATLFEPAITYPYLWFGELLSFSGARLQLKISNGERASRS